MFNECGMTSRQSVSAGHAICEEGSSQAASPAPALCQGEVWQSLEPAPWRCLSEGLLTPHGCGCPSSLS